MSHDFDYIRSRVDGIADVQTKMMVVLERNTVSLEEHMRRTALLEEAIKPLKKQHELLNAAWKIAAVVASGLVTAFGILHALRDI